jgi:hypothetical protein
MSAIADKFVARRAKYRRNTGRQAINTSICDLSYNEIISRTICVIAELIPGSFSRIVSFLPPKISG